MIQYQQLIDEIRTQLEAEELTLNDELKRLAAEYAALCKEISRRLRKCDDLLRRGLRAEALHLAEEEPKLLDLVNVADFPLRQDFVDLVSLYGQPRPESISVAVVEALNEAYFEQQPLEKLLDWHRLLALGQAPLVDRLMILRRLASSDQTNTIWIDDIREMEAARLREVEEEAQSAASTCNVTALSALVSELSDDAWSTPVPPALLKRVKQRLTNVVQVHARNELNRLKVQLDEAYTALDSPLARQLREEWFEQVRRANLSDDDPLAQHVSPILGWLQDEDSRAAREFSWNRAVNVLEAELEKPHAALEQLDRLYEQVLRTGQGLPESLEQRYRTRSDSLRLGSRRRRLMIIGSSIAGSLVVLLGIGWAIWQQLESSELASVVAAVDQLIESRDFKTAHEVLTKAERYSRRDPWLQIQQKLVDKEREEQLRQTKFNDMAQRVRDAESFASAQPDIETLQTLAITDPEKQTVVRLRDDWVARQRQMVSKRDEAARPLLDKIANSLKTLSDLDVEKLVETGPEAQIRQADADLKELAELLAEASPELGRQKDILSSRMTALKTAREEQQRRRTSLNQMTSNSLLHPFDSSWPRKLVEFEKAMQDYSKSFPNDTRSTGFKQASEAEFVRAALRTQERIHTWRDLTPLDLNQVKQRRTAIAEFLAETDKSPDALLMQEYADYLQRIVNREEGDRGATNGARNQIITMFDKPVMHDLHILRRKDGGIYYLTEEKFFTGNLVSFRYLTDYDKSNLKLSLGVKFDLLVAAATVEAPHVLLAKTVRQRFQSIPISKWQTVCVETLMELLQTDMDPVLKCLLARQTIELAGLGDVALAKGLEPLAKVFDDSGIDLSAPWMDPDNTVATANRRRAAECLERVSQEILDQVLPTATAWEKSLHARLFTKRFAIGWLNRNSDGVWSLETSWRPDGPYRLMTVAATESGTSLWQQIGELGANGASLDNEILQTNPREGQLIFAVSSEDETLKVSSADSSPLE